MTTQKKDSPFIKIAGWLIALFAFAIGFWHTHLGLREFEILSSKYGSLVVAALILLVMMVSYSIALNGKKSALIFYVSGAIFFFVFNLNSFYPSYLGRKLVTEEAITLNDSLQNYASKNAFKDQSGITDAVTKLLQAKTQILDEVRYQNGFGSKAREMLNIFNSIINEDLKQGERPTRVDPSFKVGNTQNERETIFSFLVKQLDDAINGYILRKVMSENIKNPLEYLKLTSSLDSIRNVYSPKMKIIITDNSKIHLDSVKNNSEIKTMQMMVEDINKITNQLNQILAKKNYEKLEVKSNNLGTFAHTLSSIKERLNKIDTWGIIAICLFIDLLVPLAIYFLIRRKENDDENGYDDPTLTLREKIFRKKKQQTF